MLGFKIGENKATIYDGGNTPLDLITTNKVGEALARILINPSQYLNRTVILLGVAATQQEILQAFEAKTGQKWTVEDSTSEAIMEFGLKTYETNPMVATGAIIAGMFFDKEGRYAPRLTFDDAKSLGLTPDNLKEVVDSV
jgi:hypothetical protein